MNRVRPIAIDLFSGVGGLSLGFEQAGFDVIAAVEFDPVHIAVHQYNFPATTHICKDVAEVSGDEIRNRASIQHKDIDVVVGGAPCQGFSLIGKRALDDPRNSLVAEFGRLVIELQPRYFVLENVSGLTIGNHRLFLDEVINLFQSNGYNVLTPYRVLQAAEFGVPQSRRRLFLVGSRKGLPLPEYPAPLTVSRQTDGVITSTTDLPLSPSVYDALSDLPDADNYPDLLTSDSVSVELGDPSFYAAKLRGDGTLGNFAYGRHNNPNVLTSSMRTKHTKKSITRFEATAPGTVEPVSRFLRLHPDGICNTLRAGTASDRGAYTSPRPIHPWWSRVITVREAARLHGYPDAFRFHVTKWHGFRQIGNSVPPPLARVVGNMIIKVEGIVPTKPSVTFAMQNDNLLSFNATSAQEYYGIEDRVIPQRRRGSQ